MVRSSIQACNFNYDNYCRALSNRYCLNEAVALLPQARYIYRYLDSLGAETMIIEPEYIDRDYVDDFVSYYARCFEPYDMHCIRIHFFKSLRELVSVFSIAGIHTPSHIRNRIKNIPLQPRLVENLLIGGASSRECHSKSFLSELNKAYLGFLVARPLPHAIIGRTIIQSPIVEENHNPHEEHPGLVKYHPNLLGLSLEITSLPFQQQDTVIAACATVALWSSFHKAAHIFSEISPARPQQITSAATRYFLTARSIPCRGLTCEQMMLAIREQGLQPEIFQIDEMATYALSATKAKFRSLLYAYLRMGIAPIVVGRLTQSGGKPIGVHAVTFTGYTMLEELANTGDVPLTSDRIKGFYGHDDRVGPFVLHGVESKEDSNKGVKLTRMNEDEGQYVDLWVQAVIVPIYEKVRITWDEIVRSIGKLQGLFVPLMRIQPGIYEWNIHLLTVNNYKQEVRKDPRYSRYLRAELLNVGYPRFLWRALLVRDGSILFEALFDATDIPNRNGMCSSY